MTPTLHLVGCALHQQDVATLLVRLRKLHRAADVQLGESSQSDDSAGAAAGGPTEGGAVAADSCPPKRFKFDVTVQFSEVPSALTEARRVPARLGGGS